MEPERRWEEYVFFIVEVTSVFSLLCLLFFEFMSESLFPPSSSFSSSILNPVSFSSFLSHSVSLSVDLIPSLATFCPFLHTYNHLRHTHGSHSGPGLFSHSMAEIMEQSLLCSFSCWSQWSLAPFFPPSFERLLSGSVSKERMRKSKMKKDGQERTFFLNSY